MKILENIKTEAKAEGATKMYYAEKGNKTIGIVFIPLFPEINKDTGNWNYFCCGFGGKDGIESGSNLKPEQFQKNLEKENVEINEVNF